MPIVIENMTPERDERATHEYRLTIGDKVAVTFRHRREEGLAACLVVAAKAVRVAEGRAS